MKIARALVVAAMALSAGAERRIADAIASGAPATFTLDVPANHAVHATVRRENVYLLLRLKEAGEQILFVDDHNGPNGTAMLAAPIRSVAARYQLELDPLGRDACGTYELFIESAPADETSRMIANAQQRLFEARLAERVGEEASVRKALQLLDEAYELGMRSGDWQTAAIALYRSSTLHGTLSHVSESSAALERVIPLFDELGMKGAEARSVGRLGENARRVGDVEAAERWFAKALPLSLESGDRDGEADTRNNTALLFTQIGRWDEAIAMLQDAIPIAERTGAADVLMALHHNIGFAYSEIGDYHRALDAYARSLEMKRKANEIPRRIARTLLSMVVCYIGLDDRVKARTTLDEAVQLLHIAGDPQPIAMAGLTRARMQLRAGEIDAAGTSAAATLPVLQEIDDRRGEASARLVLGEVDVHNDRLDSASAHLQRALELSRNTSDGRMEAIALYWLGRGMQKAGRLDEAIEHARAAIAVVESMRQGITDPELRSTYLGTLRRYFDLLIELLMRRHEQTPDGGFAAEAFRVNERSRARTLLESLARSSADVRKGIPSELHDRERSLRRQLSARETYRAQLMRSTRPRPELIDVEAILERLRSDYRAVEAEIRATSPEYAALVYPQPVALTDVQSRLLDADTVLLEYHLGIERSYLWAISRDDVRVHVLPDENTIEGMARTYHDLLRRNPAALEEAPARDLRRRVRQSGEALARILVHPVAAQIRGKRLLIVPDGALHYVPFSAFPDERGQPLVVHHEIAYLSSCTMLDTLRRTPAVRNAKGGVAVFADPVFQRDDSRFGGRDRALEIAGQQRATDFRRLLFSRFEADAIAAAAQDRKRLQALGFEATKQKLVRTDLREFEILHIATHAVVDAEAPELSGLVLSRYDAHGRMVDGFVRLDEIYNLELDADLVVLSACRTALGKVVYGEGLIGLTRGFLYGGARRVAATTWSVDDRATAKMMTHLYDGMLRRGLSPPAALRSAQLAMSRDARWSDPYFWAAFTLHGD